MGLPRTPSTAPRTVDVRSGDDPRYLPGNRGPARPGLRIRAPLSFDRADHPDERSPSLDPCSTEHLELHHAGLGRAGVVPDLELHDLLGERSRSVVPRSESLLGGDDVHHLRTFRRGTHMLWCRGGEPPRGESHDHGLLGAGSEWHPASRHRTIGERNHRLQRDAQLDLAERRRAVFGDSVPGILLRSLDRRLGDFADGHQLRRDRTGPPHWLLLRDRGRGIEWQFERELGAEDHDALLPESPATAPTGLAVTAHGEGWAVVDWTNPPGPLVDDQAYLAPYVPVPAASLPSSSPRTRLECSLHGTTPNSPIALRIARP